MANKDIRVDMAQLDIRAVEIIRYLNDKYDDEQYNPSEFSLALSGTVLSPKAERLLERTRLYTNELIKAEKNKGKL